MNNGNASQFLREKGAAAAKGKSPASAWGLQRIGKETWGLESLLPAWQRAHRGAARFVIGEVQFFRFTHSMCALTATRLAFAARV